MGLVDVRFARVGVATDYAHAYTDCWGALVFLDMLSMFKV